MEMGLSSYKNMYNNPINVLMSAKSGLCAQAALEFLKFSGFSKEEFRETFNTTVKTIQNYVAKDLKLDAALSEKLLKSFALYERGIEIFGTASEFYNWLHVPSFGLGNQLPINLMDTITGIGLIEEELIRIAFGTLS